VAIDELSWPNGERFSAHPEAGVFHTYLPAAGRYTVRVTSASGRTMARGVDVSPRHAFLSLDDSGAPVP
jgi:hypothetical protein